MNLMQLQLSDPLIRLKYGGKLIVVKITINLVPNQYITKWAIAHKKIQYLKNKNQDIYNILPYVIHILD